MKIHGNTIFGVIWKEKEYEKIEYKKEKLHRCNQEIKNCDIARKGDIMLNLTYVGESNIHKIEFNRNSEHIVSIKGSLPAQTNGFILSREGKKDNWDYKDFTTVYRELDGEIQFSNDGSIYVEPIPKVGFYTNGGGTLEGETVQEAKNYEELVIPTPVAGENYEFTHWSPEIPLSGEIEGNKSFAAVFVSTLPPPEPVPTLEERVATVEENNAMLTECVLEMSGVIYA